MDEELEKCKCSTGCTCEDDCTCTPDNKCCDECSCDTNCKCHNENNCTCEDDCKCNDLDETCECDEHNKCNEDCKCDEEANNCNDCDDVKDDVCDEKDECDNCETEEEKCKCGCGESVEEESSADAYFSQLLSLRAEFDNYRKRTQNDISKAYSNGFNQAITEFLPALDSFKMASEYITDPNTLMGIQYIEKGILSTLEKMGVKAIDVSGKFDPNFHQAIGSEVSTEHESGDIIKECFKGFTMGDKVIRYSQVIVCK